MRKKWSLIIMVATIFGLSGCAGKGITAGVNANGNKQYELVNEMSDQPNNIGSSSRFYVNAKYIYEENSDIVKITLTNIAQVMMVGHVNGYDMVIGKYSLYIDGTRIPAIKCDEPLSNGNIYTKSRVVNSLTCDFKKESFLTFINILEKNVFFEVNFYKAGYKLNPNIFNDPTSYQNIICQRALKVGGPDAHEQCWASVILNAAPIKQTADILPLSRKDANINLKKFANCIETKICQN